jgi:hypothetical protein
LYARMKKSKKTGISTFIATLLMMVLAVAAGVVIYAYTMGYLGSFGPPSQPGTLQVQSIAQDINGVHIYAKNIGKSTVVLDANAKAYIDGQLVNGAPYTISPIPTSVVEGETREFLIQGFTQQDVGKTKEVKIVFNDGGFAATSVKITQDVVSGGATTYSVVYVLGTGGSTMNPTGTQTYAAGSSVAISATPDGTHTFSQWQATGSITFDNAASASTNAHINGAGTITATFSTTGTQYTVTFVLGAGGASISPTAGAHTYGDGSTVPITATANTGYHFTTWSSDTGSITFDSATTATTNAHIGAAGTITANFAADTAQYSVTFVLGTGGSSMTPTPGAHTYDDGSTVAITATALTNYHFDSWSSDTGSITFDNAALASTNAHIVGAGTITANFAQDEYTLTAYPDPAAGGSVTKNPNLASYHIGDVVTISQTHNPGYSFTGWSGDGVDSGADRVVTLSGNAVVTANYIQTSPLYVTAMSPVHDTNVGTHSNFPDMQNDGVMDTLREGNVATGGTWVIPTGDSGSSWSNRAGAHDNNVNTYANTNINSNSWSGTLILSYATTTGTALRYHISRETTSIDTILIEVYNTVSASWDTVYNGAPTADTYTTVTFTSKTTNQMRISFHSSSSRTRWVTVNEAHIQSDNVNYQLDLEIQFSGITNFAYYTQLEVKTGTFNGENVQIQYWTGSAWSTLGTLAASTTNTYTVALTGSSYELRFYDATRTSDTIQDTWQIDYVRLVAP